MFTIMTWNVENLFQPTPAQRPAYEAKLDALTAVTHDAAPDLLAVQEVGDQASFDALRQRLGGAGPAPCPATSRHPTLSGSAGYPPAR
jgi:hypothetical protein